MSVRSFRLAVFVLPALVVACGGGGGDNPGDDSGTGTGTGTATDAATSTDGSSGDSASRPDGSEAGGSDASGGDSTGEVGDDAASSGDGGEVGDAGADVDDTYTGPCEAGTVDTRSCGKCGTQSRLCDTTGKYLDWGVCAGETGVCVPGATKSVSCSRCGTRVETCSATCSYGGGTCTGMGTCNPGDTEVQYGACTNPKQVKIRSCDSSCTWSTYSACAAPPGWDTLTSSTISGRQYHSAVWTGTQMIVWGGQTASSYYGADGAAYTPSTDSWSALTTGGTPPTGRYYHTAVWTGSQMLVWGGYATGGYTNTGGIYDPSAGWSAMAVPTGFAGRYYHAAIWSSATNEMIVWGGTGTCGSYCADGAAYKPSTNTWRIIAPATIAGREYMGFASAGGKLVVFGGLGSGCTGSYCADGAVYDPAADKWTAISTPYLDGRWYVGATAGPGASQVTFFGGQGVYTTSSYRSNGAVYDVSTGAWTALPAIPTTVLSSPYRANPYVWTAGTKFFMVGGTGDTSPTTGAFIDLSASSPAWTALSTAGAPTTRSAGTVVWDGAEALFYGGQSYRTDGSVYRP